MPFRAVTVTTDETEIAGDSRKRRTLTFVNRGPDLIFFSQDRANIQTQGFPVAVGQVVVLSTTDGDDPGLPLYARADTFNADVRVVESVGEPEPTPVKQVT